MVTVQCGLAPGVFLPVAYLKLRSLGRNIAVMPLVSQAMIGAAIADARYY